MAHVGSTWTTQRREEVQKVVIQHRQLLNGFPILPTTKGGLSRTGPRVSVIDGGVCFLQTSNAVDRRCKTSTSNTRLENAMTLTRELPLVNEEGRSSNGQKEDLGRVNRAAAAVVQLGHGPGEVRSLATRGQLSQNLRHDIISTSHSLGRADL